MYRLLIADGDDDARAHVMALLPWSALGVGAIDEAASYSDAVDLALRTRPQAALVALTLDGQRGYDLVAHLLAAGLKTAFCIMAESDAPELIRSCMRAGARDYLLKPITAYELRAFLSRTVAGSPPDPSPLSEPFADSLHLDAARLSPLTRRILAAARSGLDDPPVSLMAIAEALHMNSKYLGRVFLRDTGMKFSEYQFVCRMEQARQLIVQTREKISVIASAVGYSQLNRFYVHFRTYFGFSPGALRGSTTPPEDIMREGHTHETTT